MPVAGFWCYGGLSLAYSILEDQLRTGELLGDPTRCYKNYRKGINKGLLKIMSKMGISAVNSYRGAQLFERWAGSRGGRRLLYRRGLTYRGCRV